MRLLYLARRWLRRWNFSRFLGENYNDSVAWPPSSKFRTGQFDVANHIQSEIEASIEPKIDANGFLEDTNKGI